jgi:tetratricopeptide (TPR) repeat protein
MFSKLSFGQKLAVWLGCALVVIIASITAICFNIAKNGPPKDLEKFLNREAIYTRYYDETDWHKEEQSASGKIASNPKSAYWYSTRGSARWQLGNTDGAFNDYDTAVHLDPNDYSSLACRATLNEIRGNHEQALQDANKAISMKPGVGWIYAARAHIYSDQADYEAALADLDMCLKNTEEKRRYFAQKAEIYSKIRRFDKAISALEQGTQQPKTSKNDQSFKQLVQLYISAGELKQAQKACERWIEDTNPDSAAFVYSENVCLALNDTDAEGEACQKHLDFLNDKIGIHPTDMKLYEQRATVYEKLDKVAKAREDYQAVIEDFERNKDKGLYAPNQIIKFGHYYKIIGKESEQLKLYRAEIEKYNIQLKKNQKDVFSLLFRAELFGALGDKAAAMRDFETAKMFKNSNTAIPAYAEYALKMREYDLAFSLYRELLETKRALAYARFAQVYELKGEHREAIDSANIALTIDRVLPDAYYWLGKARASKGDFAESKRRLQQATALGYDPNSAQPDDFVED